jgi:hypothetical protein
MVLSGSASDLFGALLTNVTLKDKTYLIGGQCQTAYQGPLFCGRIIRMLPSHRRVLAVLYLDPVFRPASHLILAYLQKENGIPGQRPFWCILLQIGG